MIPTLIAVAVLVFLVLRVVPGDIVELKLTAEGGEVTLEQIGQMKAKSQEKYIKAVEANTKSEKKSQAV